MKVRDIMKKLPIFAHTDTMVRTATEIMQQHGVTAMPVLKDSVLDGLITDHIIIERSIAKGREPFRLPVGEIMDPEPVVCDEEMNLDDAVGLMKNYKTHYMVVVDINRNPTGIISLEDIFMNTNVRITDQEVQPAGTR